MKRAKSLKTTSQSSNDRKSCRKHDGNTTFLLVSCILLRNVTVSSLLHTDLMFSCIMCTIIYSFIIWFPLHQLLHLSQVQNILALFWLWLLFYLELSPHFHVEIENVHKTWGYTYKHTRSRTILYLKYIVSIVTSTGVDTVCCWCDIIVLRCLKTMWHVTDRSVFSWSVN